MTSIKLTCIVFLILSTGQAFGQANSKVIFFYIPYMDSTETNLYRDTLVKFDFKTQYVNIKNADIEKEVEKALLHNDYRIVGISGVSYLYPGLEGGYKTNKDGTKVLIRLDPKYESYMKKYGFKVVKGTSDSINSDNPPLQSVAYEFAKKYNLQLVEKIKTKK
ncbi:MAG: hypothetical protein CFE21_15580 [Bacteroidetes bacterium B1(2017)]|nr:MAG: hypothetical protein CFE21_15580 [Bacteroidetes bacterium B1(2017)]